MSRWSQNLAASAAAIAALAAASACRAEPETKYGSSMAEAGAALERIFVKDDIKAAISVAPRTVSPAAFNEVTISLSGPKGSEPEAPADMADRFEGFAVEAAFSTKRSNENFDVTVMNFRLRPMPGAAAYRIKPFAVAYADLSAGGADADGGNERRAWFPTEMLALQAAKAPVEAAVSTSLKPRRITLSARGVARQGAAGLAALAVAAALAFAASKLHLARKIRSMTPGERAMRELSALLSRNLPDKGLFKDFYVELTMVVRRYIERRHGIRAPEQTTEEFLAAAADGEAIPRGHVAELKPFLEAADLVKFAGREATLEIAAEATEKARGYIRDAELVASADGADGANTGKPRRNA